MTVGEYCNKHMDTDLIIIRAVLSIPIMPYIEIYSYYMLGLGIKPVHCLIVLVL